MNSRKCGYQEAIHEKAIIKIQKLYFLGYEECTEKDTS